MLQKYRGFLVVLGVSVVYSLVAVSSLNLALEKTSASPIWPPSGIAFAALLIFGRRALWGIFIGAVAANIYTFQGNLQFSVSIVLCSLLIGIGNTLEAFLSEKFYRSFRAESGPLDNYSNFFKMLMVTFAACLIGAVIGVSSLLLTEIIPLDLYRAALVTWWMGDYVGVLIFTPLILSLANFKKFEIDGGKALEFMIHLVILIVTCTVIFSNIGSGTILSELSFIILPFLLWMVYRFSVPYIGIAVTTVSLISVMGTVNGYGPFVRPDLNESLLLLQAFMGITSVTFISLGITLNEKKLQSHKPAFNETFKYSAWFSSVSFIVCLFLSLFVIYSISEKKDRQVIKRIEKELNVTNNFIIKELEFISEGLSRMGMRRSNFPGMAKETWEKDAGHYYNDYEIFKSIEWVDANYRVKWTYPIVSQGHNPGLSLNFESKRKNTLDQAREQSRVVISPPMDLIKGGRGVMLAMPVYHEKQFDGFILGICETENLFNSFLSNLEKNYFIQVSSNGLPEYLSNDFQENYYKFQKKADFSGLSWELKFVPRPEFLKLLGKEPMTFSVVIAFFISVLFSLTVYLIFNARYKAMSLSELNESLIRKNEELNRERKISQQAALAKSQFLANMSHEIRTPMNGVLGALQLAMDSREDEVKNYLKVIDISARNLMDIIDDILDYSKIEAGKMELEVIPFDLKKIVQESLVVVEGKARSQEVELFAEFKLDSGHHFKGDPTRIRQILLNLLSNAVKFTKKGKVKVYVNRNEAEQVCITVEDNGIGISEEQLKHIFDQFEQADKSTTRQYGGTGLGLAITKQLVELMDGNIEVKSEIDKGTQFIVTLPIEQTEIRLVEQKFHLERKYGKRVLLCEDNKTNQMVIKEILEKLGIDVEVASDGEEAVEAVENSTFDLVIMDLHMPRKDGIESSTEIIRNNPRLPIIALTAVTEENVREECLNIGIKGFLTKPVQRHKLVDELDKWLGRAS